MVQGYMELGVVLRALPVLVGVSVKDFPLT